MCTTRVLAAVGMLSISGCLDLGTSPEIVPRFESIRAAVFEYQIGPNASGQQGNVRVYFLALYDYGDSLRYGYYYDPSDQLMATFAGHTPSVKKYSSCTIGGDANQVYDRETGVLGLLFYIGSIKETGPEEVEVVGGYYADLRSASVNIYTVRKSEGRWAVVKDEMIGIS